jgi:two-component system NtrC family sensor kinase
MFEGFPAALLSLDTGLRVVMMNAAAEELTGFGRPEIEGRRANALMGVAQLRYITRVLRERGRFQTGSFITKMRSKGGGEIPVRLVVSPLRRGRRDLAGILCVISDLRSVKRIQGKLLEAERLAALSEIAAGLSHAINNPLCAILGNTQLLLMESDRLDAGAVKKLRSIEREISRIQRVAERLPRITRPASREYVGGRRMLDIEASGQLRRPRPRGKPAKQ